LAKREEEVLRSLSEAGVAVPAVYDSFELNSNQYLVTEFIAGETLEQFLQKRRRRLRIERALAYAIQIASLLEQIHAAGWAWRDCKPANIILTARGVLRPVDFEGAWPLHGTDSRLWSTAAYNPPDSRHLSGTQADLYAFAIVTHLLLTGRLPQPGQAQKFKRNIPARVRELLRELMIPSDRFHAANVRGQLRLALDEETALRTSLPGSQISAQSEVSQTSDRRE
jgi:serine/threonine protein kinase